jgi:hypothetical protein
MALAFTFEGASIHCPEQDDSLYMMVFRFAQCLCSPIPLECWYLYGRQVYKTLRFATWRAFGFWHVVAIITDALLLTAFILRVSGLASLGGERDQLRLHSFQVLSFVSPFIWCVLDYFGVRDCQEPCSRMSASAYP